VRKDDGVMDTLMLTLLAHLSAHRRLLINLYTSGLIEDAAPVNVARKLQQSFANAPTQAPENGNSLDPATSDLLAAMTDEAIEDLLDRVILRLEEACCREDRQPPTYEDDMRHHHFRTAR
jgi:hypothetical protein